jgi:hypothetical protein
MFSSKSPAKATPGQNDLAGQPTGIIRSHEGHDISDILWLAYPHDRRDCL